MQEPRFDNCNVRLYINSSQHTSEELFLVSNFSFSRVFT